MNKLLDYIKKNYVLISIIVALGIIIGIFATHKEASQVPKADTGVFWHSKYDSIQMVDLNDKIEISKALQASDAYNNKLITENNKLLKHKSDSSEIIARKDSNENCNKALADKNSLIGGLFGVIKSDSTQLSECHKEVVLKDSVNILSKEDIVFLTNANLEVNNANAILQKQVGRSFIEKHGLETGFVGAVILATFAKFVLFK